MDLPPFRLLSLCTGLAGLDLGVALGLPQARVACYVENEPYCQKLLQARMQDGLLDDAPLWDDLRTFRARPWRGRIDLITCGAPCQPISVAGRRKGSSDDRWLWPDVLRIIDAVRPRFAFFENPTGLRSGGEDAVCDLDAGDLGDPTAESVFRSWLGLILGGLAEIGYDVWWTVLGADDVGAPHRRKRIFLLAMGDPAHSDVLDVCGERRDTEGTREGWPGHAAPAGRGSDEPVGEPTGPRLEERGGQRGNAGEELPAALGAGAVGDPQEQPQREPHHAERAVARQDAWADAGGAGLFPPRPGDRDAWEPILACRSELAPAIAKEDAESSLRQLADGSHARMDAVRPSLVKQLSAVGNACCPLQASVALGILAVRAAIAEIDEDGNLILLSMP